MPVRFNQAIVLEHPEMDIDEELGEIKETEGSEETKEIEEMMDNGKINDENQQKFSLIDDLEMNDQNHTQDAKAKSTCLHPKFS